MKLLDRLNNIEINQSGYHLPENTIKIDGKTIEGVRNVKVEYGINTALPIITIEFYARISGLIKAAQGVIKIEERSEAEIKEAWDKIKPKKKGKKP